MKKLISFLLGTLLIVACAEKTDKEKKETLQAKIQELEASVRILKSEVKDIDAKSDTLEKLTTVYVEEMKNMPYSSYVKVNALVSTDQNVIVMPEASGTIQQIKVRRGQSVRKGQTLAIIDNSVLRKNMSELKSRLSFATTLFEKQQRLYKQNVGTEVQYLQAKNNKESIENSMATLRSQMRKTTVVAPISGKVDQIFPKQGELASPGSPVVRLVSTNHLYAEADISEAYIGKVNLGDSVEVYFPFLKKSYKSKITYKNNFINPNNRTFKVHVALNKIKAVPNMLIILKFRDVYIKKAITIPAKIIKNDGVSDFVYTVKNSVTTKNKIKTISLYNGLAAVEGELKEGDLLVTKGYTIISKGEKINIAK